MNLKNASASEMATWLSTRLNKRVSVNLDSITNLQGHLYAIEESLLGNAIPKRAREFRSGRTAARKCMLELGLEPGPILIGEKREPLWPAGCVGTISHCGNYCLVMISPSAGSFSATSPSAGNDSDSTLSLGADIEQLGRVKALLWPRIFTTVEKDFLNTLDSREADRAATAMFSAKEAFFKLQHPLTGLWLGFQDAEVSLGKENSFEITVRKPLKKPMMEQTYAGTYNEWQECCIAVMGI
ncbi:MAG: 4'-phosphopantetheinyl transferase superfamily protein [Acidobacteriota bacterium]